MTVSLQIHLITQHSLPLLHQPPQKIWMMWKLLNRENKKKSFKTIFTRIAYSELCKGFVEGLLSLFYVDILKFLLITKIQSHTYFLQ